MGERLGRCDRARVGTNGRPHAARWRLALPVRAASREPADRRLIAGLACKLVRATKELLLPADFPHAPAVAAFAPPEIPPVPAVAVVLRLSMSAHRPNPGTY